MRKTRKVKWFLMLAIAIFVMPAVVDAETTVSLTPTDDAYVDDANPSSNYGSSSSLYVGDTYQNDPPKITRSYLKFDISGIPAGATIVSAKLHIGSVGAGPNPPLGVGSHYLPDDLWTEGSITFKNAPTNLYNVSTDNALVENKDHNLQCCDCWDVLKAVKDARDGLDDPTTDVEGVLSIVLRAMSWFEGSQNSWCQLCSKEDTTGYGYEPELVITYDEGGGGSVSPGTDCYITEHAMIMFGTPENPPIPPGFFGPGSDPFMGHIDLKGEPAGGVVNTQIARKTGGELPATVDTEIVALSLVSTEPIMVHNSQTMMVSFYDVFVTISMQEPSPGSMTISKTHENGGTFDSFFDITYQIEFIPHEPTSGPLRYTTGVLGVSSSNNLWQDTPVKEPEILPCNDNDFYPTGEEMVVLGGESTMLELKVPQSVQRYFLLACQSDWQEALDSGEVRPMTREEWDASMNLWQTGEVEGEPYNYGKPAEFVPATLYAYGEGPDGGSGLNDCSDDGLLMVWSTEDQMPVIGQDYGSAWVYAYPEDPDLSNCIISVDVHPPASITTVSYRMMDINGLTREWWWNVPADIPATIFTTVTIDTSLTGIGATNPTAAGYVSAAGFDITKVASMAADENGTWFPDVVSPPPGGGVSALWNYWYNLSVTPKSPGSDDANSKWFVKYSQPPVVLESGLIFGWDEYSNYHNPPMMADDWLCEDERPITDFHWWGSFIGWTKTTPPPVVPKAFHIGIWTDVPAGVGGIPYSRPDRLVWENYCDNWIWNFAGYDRDPRLGDDTTGWEENEACFQFAQFLSEDEWFKQQPEEPWPWDEVDDMFPNGRVYWLSIAAIYDSSVVPPMYPWGWKTRERNFNDDAVRIYSVTNAGGTAFWPPTVGSTLLNAQPVEYPAGASWDLCFELTTNEGIAADLNHDGEVGLPDFNIMARAWLTSISTP